MTGAKADDGTILRWVTSASGVETEASIFCVRSGSSLGAGVDGTGGACERRASMVMTFATGTIGSVSAAITWGICNVDTHARVRRERTSCDGISLQTDGTVIGGGGGRESEVGRGMVSRDGLRGIASAKRAEGRSFPIPIRCEGLVWCASPLVPLACGA